MTKNTTARLALFDFDGTITDRDSEFDFLRFVFGWSGLALKFPHLAAPLLRWELHRLSSKGIKETLFRRFFADWSHMEFLEATIRYSHQGLPAIIRPRALDAINSHRANGDRVLVVSASPYELIAPWALQNQVELVANHIEHRTWLDVWHFDGPEYSGAEKVRQIRTRVRLEDYSEIYAYGNSEGDRDMLEAATHPHYRYFE